MDIKKLLSRTVKPGSNYMPEIDSLRFLAITMVVIFHIVGYVVGKYFHSNTIPEDGVIASIVNQLIITLPQGVEIFFVISGFVLSLPFANYYLKGANPLSIKKFYMRRLTRLEPPYILVLTLLFILSIATHKYTFDTLLPSYFASLFYLHNIIFNHSPLLTVVAWSLEVEIQFYIIAPLIALIFTFGKSLRYTIWLCTIIAFPIFQKLYLPPFLCLYQFIQYFILGFLLSDIYVSSKKPSDNILTRVGGYVVLVILLFVSYRQSIWHEYIFMLTVFLFCYFVLLTDYWKKVFSHPWLAIIGGMCYTIYLLHYPVVSLFGGILVNFLPASLGYVTLSLIFIVILSSIIFALSAIYFILIEKPCMDHAWPSKLKTYLKTLIKPQKETQF